MEEITICGLADFIFMAAEDQQIIHSLALFYNLSKKHFIRHNKFADINCCIYFLRVLNKPTILTLY